MRRGRPADTLFAFNDHFGPDVFFHLYMRPAERIVNIGADLDYFSFDAFATVVIDPVKRTVTIDRMLCRTDNVWPEIMNRDAPKSGQGGIAWFNANVRFVNERNGDDASIERLVELFFGCEWTAVVPLTRPEIGAADLESAERCRDDRRDATTRPPWGHVIAMYSPMRSEAAIVIQRHFRGWRTRMRTAFDPNTRIGAYYALREFRALPFIPGFSTLHSDELNVWQ